MATRPIRILHVVHGLPRGGLERGVVNLCNRLPPSEFFQAVCCLDIRGEMADLLGPRIEVMEMDRERSGLRTLGGLARLFRRWAPDVIHCRNWNAWPDTVLAHRFARVLRGTRPTLVWSFHGFPDIAPMPWRRRILSRGLARFTDHAVAVCRDSADRFADQAGLLRSRFEVLYNGVDCARFSPSEDKAAVRRRLGLPEEPLLVLTAASLTPIKNHELLVAAVALLRRRLSRDVRFLLLGEGALRPDIETQIGRLGLEDVLSLPGASDQVLDYLQAADVFVLPSRLEGMSNAILEAMACGLPVIAFRTGGNPELVVDSETGLLPEIQSPAILAEAIETLVSDEGLRLSMREAGRERAVKEFSIDAMMERYAGFYRRVARAQGVQNTITDQGRT